MADKKMSIPRAPAHREIANETPLRLAAARSACISRWFDVGERCEAARGRLVIERTAGKDYTTLAAIEQYEGTMPEAAKARDCGPEGSGETRPASSRMNCFFCVHETVWLRSTWRLARVENAGWHGFERIVGGGSQRLELCAVA
jgi:hypothetical protein